jgi:hypothetical protein
MNIFPSETAVNAIHTSFLREPLDTVNCDGLQAQKDLAVFASQRWPLLLTTETRQNFFVVDFARLKKHPSWAPRLYWIWPLQVIFLAASVTYLPSKLRIARPLIWMGQILLALIVFGNPLLVSRFNSWLESGHAGSDAERIRAVDYIGGQLRSQGRSNAAIGYHVITSRLHAGFPHSGPAVQGWCRIRFLF